MAERCFDETHLSYSSDRTWDECQYKSFAFKNGLAPLVVNEKMLIGSSVDAYVSGALSGEPLTKDDAWNKALADMRERYKVTLMDETKAVAQHLAYCDKADEEVIPVMADRVRWVQPEWHFVVDGETYHAHPDFVLDDYSIVDLKTSGRRFDAERVHVDQQLTAYAYALRAATGFVAPSVALVGLIGLKAGVVVDTQVGTRSEAQLDAWEDDARARIATRRFSKSFGFYARQGRASMFACKGCSVRPSCPSWAGTELLAATLGEE
jgi:hypothetical protein